MQCKTERCLIRELVPDDWKSMQKIAVDFRKSKYAVYDMPLPVEDAEIIARTKQFAQTQMFYAVLLHDVMIGYICFHEDHGMYDLGYCFHSDYQGKGYAFESCCAMMNYIFHERSINIFTAGTALENKPSCKLLEKLGFTLQNENYDWDTLAKNSIFVGAYDGEPCVGLAILQQAMMKYMYLYDLKVNADVRGRRVGTMLIEKSKEVALEQGIPRAVYTGTGQ